jgi:hypothetical protein
MVGNDMRFKRRLIFRYVVILFTCLSFCLIIAFIYGNYKTNRAIKLLDALNAEYHYDTESYSSRRGWYYDTPQSWPKIVQYFCKKDSVFANIMVVYLPPINFKNHNFDALADLHNIDSFVLDGSQSVDMIMSIVGRLRFLWYLSIKRTDLTDNGLADLVNLNNLFYLYLDDTLITDKGLSSISKLKKLQWLGVARCGISDEGYKTIGKMNRLELIRLGGNKNSDQGWKYIENHNELASLIIVDSVLDKDAINSIAKIKNLKILDLYNVDIKKDAMPSLEKLKQITELSIRDMPFTDSDLMYLIKSEKLLEITLFKTLVTKEAVAKLKSQKPDMLISLDDQLVQENSESFK